MGVRPSRSHDDNTGSGQVDAHASSFRGEKEARDALVFIEFVDKSLPHIDGSRTGEDEILEPLVLQHLLQDVKDLGELEEHEHLLMSKNDSPRTCEKIRIRLCSALYR